MSVKTINKKKIINDPVHGFIPLHSELVYDLIEHPIFQRLRRIRQLGLTNYVYPGANHTRFQHAIGASYLMQQAILTIRGKGFEITSEEEEAAIIAILLHDVGHGPFSHALEHSLIDGITHEDLSHLFMQQLNIEFGNKLSLAIDIFQGAYKKQFLHQLVSSQLDMDRLDYLSRDSFFTGVTEGSIGSSRIIKMLNVVNDQLVLESKGIYSIENFLIARRLMYWQVYLHKTVIAAESLLVSLLKRAKELTLENDDLFAPPSLKHFLVNNYNGNGIKDIGNSTTQQLLNNFIELDDNEIFVAAKVWRSHPDKILSSLANGLLHRKLPKTLIRTEPLTEAEFKNVKQKVADQLKLSAAEYDYFVYTDTISNHAYDINEVKIQVLYGDGQLKDITDASDILNVSILNKSVKKYYLCYPKNCSI